MTHRSLQSKRVLLTGASSGIGWALAHQLATHGARLIVTARRETRLVELIAACQRAGQSPQSIKTEGNSADRASSDLDMDYIAGDISDPTTRQRLIEQINTRWNGCLDILINNAGIGAFGPFRAASPERLHQIMQVNFVAPAELIRSALPALSKGDRPIVVNVGSVLGHVGVPKKSEYCASKFALRGFTDSLRSELAPDGIDVLWVAPNTTRSEFFDHLIEQQGQVATNPFSMTSEAVARKTLASIRRGRSERILTLSGRLLILARRWLPKTLERVLQRR